MANEFLEEKKKHKEAALKAWKTIRKDKRKRAASNSAKITGFISPENIEKVKHPELLGSKDVVDE